MRKAKTTYIALGSNKGNKLQNLQSAVDLIFLKIGDVKKISNVYETAALGFDGDDFYNACIKVETDFKPKKLLKQLQSIEKVIGRVKSSSNMYESREIDLDILFYDELVLSTNQLQIPHPRIKQRKFVLLPMFEIEATFLHPEEKKTIEELLKICSDSSFVKKVYE